MTSSVFARIRKTEARAGDNIGWTGPGNVTKQEIEKIKAGVDMKAVFLLGIILWFERKYLVHVSSSQKSLCS